MTLEEVQRLAQEALTPNYSRMPVAFVRGYGTRLWDTDGKEYLDFLTGIAVCGLGHCHPKLTAAIQHQASMLWHTSNLFHNPLQAKLAKRLSELSGGYKCFFCNSGAEANEAALKLARKIGNEKLGGKWEIIAAIDSFHGRTYGALSVTGQPKYHQGFEPLLPGIKFVPFGDAKAIEEAITDKTCAVILEPIQGESGVRVPPDEYLPKVAEICRGKGVLLILDESRWGWDGRANYLPSNTTTSNPTYSPSQKASLVASRWEQCSLSPSGLKFCSLAPMHQLSEAITWLALQHWLFWMFWRKRECWKMSSGWAITSLRS